MNITLIQTGQVHAVPTIAAPPSKSDAHRLLILAALSEGNDPITLACRDTNADIDATVRCLQALGAQIHRDAAGFTVIPLSRTSPHDGEIYMDVGESGSTLRFLIPVIGALGIPAVLRRGGRLPDRPLAPLDAVLTAHGMTLYDDSDDRTLLHLGGQLHAGSYEIDGGVASQFISGLLFALPLLDAPSTLTVTGTVSSAPYIALTCSALSRFGYPTEPDGSGYTYHLPPARFAPSDGLTVEGDWSGAAFLLCAGAVGTGVAVTGLNPDSIQGDRRITEVLAAAGCRIAWDRNTLTVSPPQDGVLRPFTLNADDIPDLVPPIAVLACAAHGTSQITGCARLRIKESDRLNATRETLLALGGAAETTDDTITVHGLGALAGGSCDGCGDHRMVMSAALAACIAASPVTVSDREAITKSYPGFFDDFCAFGIQEMSVGAQP